MRRLLVDFLLHACVWEVATSTRPCTDKDWRFSFGLCSNGYRNAFMYPAGANDVAGALPAVCSPQMKGSWPRQMPPALNLSCDHRCASGTHVGVQLQSAPRTAAGATMSLVCKDCPAGKFSLGGGMLISGVAGDWRRRWPVEMQSSCMWKGPDGHWKVGTQRHHGPIVNVEVPASISGTYVLASAAWNDALQQAWSPLLGTLRLAPGDGLACVPLQLPKDASKTILLVKQGGCTPYNKVTNAATAGAYAVLLISSGYQSLPSVPGRGRTAPGKQPGIPLFALGREDAELFLVALNQSAVLVNVSYENSTLAQPDGCKPWVADPAGRFVSSGDNRNNHQMVSILTLSTHLVRPGHVIFRYAVSAEKGFDGLSFEVDWNRRLSLQSDQAEYKAFKINISAGPHNLKWMYSKDYSTSKGRDTAWVQVIEVTGTAHADLQCRGCHSARTHSGEGAAHCNVCKRDEYLSTSAASHMSFSKCMSCPAGKWSAAGAIGVASCQNRLPCGPKDVSTTYSACVNFKRIKRRSWRNNTCDPHGKDSLLGTREERLDCEPCQPNEHRPDGGTCQAKYVSCPSTEHGVRERVVSHWYSWPKNFSKEVWIMREETISSSPNENDPLADQSDSDHPNGHHWSLAQNGAFAFAGEIPGLSNAPGSGTGSSSNPHGERFGDALLHFDVRLMAEGSVTFFIEVFPVQAWGHEAKFFVDNLQVPGLQPVKIVGNLLQVFTSLTHGLHRLTWAWEYHSTHDGAEIGSPHAGTNGVKLLNVSVVHVVGAGTARCEPCPSGEEIGPDGKSCIACQPGQFLEPKALRCQPCPVNNFSAAPRSTSCRPCGPGLRSDGNATLCKPMMELKAIVNKDDVEDAATLDAQKQAQTILHTINQEDYDPYVFDVSAILSAWKRASADVTGPFAVGGRQFVVSLFSPTRVPGVEDTSTAYVWELLQHGRESDSACGRESANGRDSLGTIIARVDVIVHSSVRGVSVSYVEGERCGESVQFARAAKLQFVCSLRETTDPPARKDELGLYHMPRLSLGTSSIGSTGCENVTLEWPTRAACPLCRTADYTKKVTVCGNDGFREVTFTRKAKCLGGKALPLPYREKCGDTKKKKGKMKVILMIVVICAVVAAAGLCCYACYLHKRYAKYVDL